MSREVRRVPLDFDAPLNQVWQGYTMPESLYGDPCDRCHGGETWASRWLYLLCIRISMLAADVRDQEQGKPMHPWLDRDPYPAGNFVRDDNGHATRWKTFRPSADILNLIAGIAGRDPKQIGGFFGAGNPEIDLYKAIVKASGLEHWGSCEHCGGRGEHERYEGQRTERDAWKRPEPPAGEGFQLWSTVSDGKPVSPVFPTAEDLAVWLTTPQGGRACGPSGPMTIEQARGFVDEGWAPTGVGDAGGFHDGPSFIGSESVLAGIEQATTEEL